MIRTLFQRALQGGAYTLYLARDGLQALAILDSVPVDLILTDIRMPVLSGADLIRLVCSSDQRPRIILTSGDLRARQYSDLLALVDYVLPKPVDLARLVAMVEHLLSESPCGDSGGF
ncbi:response regulator [Candidatus Gracilibacteria bacterium]|nr:response regulator [Candidatus Gracilibacteria bacterium]